MADTFESDFAEVFLAELLNGKGGGDWHGSMGKNMAGQKKSSVVVDVGVQDLSSADYAALFLILHLSRPYLFAHSLFCPCLDCLEIVIHAPRHLLSVD